MTDAYGTIAGGSANQAGDNAGTTAGAPYATVGGGTGNKASGDVATVAGGSNNVASGAGSTVPGGEVNRAGGDYSFAAGQFAIVRDPNASGDGDGDEGTFVWNDSISAPFISTGPNQFDICASAGLRLATGDGSTPQFQAITHAGTATDLRLNPFGGRVGIQADPSSLPYPLQVKSAFTTAIYGETSSADAGWSGVSGVASASTGAIYGGYFESHGHDGAGVYGVATSNLGSTYGVEGVSTSTSTGASGVYGVSASSQGTGVYGLASATSGTTYGGRFDSESAFGRGVYATGMAYGVYGESVSTAGTGVYGHTSALTGTTYGVYGASQSSTGTGVRGVSLGSSGTGVFGRADTTSGTNYGVYGETASASGYGVYCVGRFAATGTKAFQIDHPLDPANQYLNHYTTEVPEPLNVYSGNVVTDARGYATVGLPDYFESINRDFRYQLTVLDDGDRSDFVQVKVAQKIRDNRFVIRSSAPAVEVSCASRPCATILGLGLWRSRRAAEARGTARQIPEPGTIRPAEGDGDQLRRGA